MSDTLKLAMRISAIDLFSGVLRRFRNEIAGTGAQAKAMQRDYDNMVRHTSAGLKSLAVASYGAHLLKPAISAAAELQESSLALKGILQGSHPNAKKLADEMARASQNAIAVAKHMQYSAKEVMDVQTQLYQGGLPLDAILGGNKGAAFAVEALAEIRKVDPAETASNIANVGHSFQLRPDEYGAATDLIARGSILASGGLGQLFHNLDQVGARAHMLGNMDLKSTVIALKALSPLGAEAGSDLGNALSVMTGGSLRGQGRRKAWGLNFYKDGKFIGLDDSLEVLQKKMAKQNQQQRNAMLGEVFGQTGGKAITQLLAPSLPGVKSYAEIKDSLDKQASLAQQVTTREEGLSMNLEELSSTNKTTLAALFDPMLDQMTKAIKLANKLDGAIGSIASHHKGLSTAVSATATGAIAAAGGYGLYRLGRGGLSLRSFLKGKAALAGGIAEGKAVQAATGIAPVFVTNFPAGFGSGLGGAAAREAEAASVARGATAAEAGTVGGRLAAGARGFAMTDVAVAAGLAYALKPVQAFLDPYAKKVTAFMAGGTEDQLKERNLGLNDRQYASYKSLEKQHPYADWDHKGAGALQSLENYKKWLRQEATRQSSDVSGTIHIQIDQQGRAKVVQVKSNNPKVAMDVHTMMSVP